MRACVCVCVCKRYFIVAQLRAERTQSFSEQAQGYSLLRHEFSSLSNQEPTLPFYSAYWIFPTVLKRSEREAEHVCVYEYRGRSIEVGNVLSFIRNVSLISGSIT
jgi:hypothetical protein